MKLSSPHQCILLATNLLCPWLILAAEPLPYGGKPQEIPGTLVPGYYDLGGAGVAYGHFPPFDAKKQPPLSFRASEFGYSGDPSHALLAGPSAAPWICYTVAVPQGGAFETELLLNRPDYYLKNAAGPEQTESIQLEADGKPLAEWTFGSRWVSGNGWRTPVKPAGKQVVHLSAGVHRLTVRFEKLQSRGFHFGGFSFRPVIFGNVFLPAQATVFAPFLQDDGVPPPELLRRMPAVLELGGKRAEGRAATFHSRRIADLATFCGQETGNTAWVYFPFQAESAGPVTFGFGADWWYEAYLDGALLSATLSRREGNVLWPPGIHDFTATAELAKGAHLLVVRFVRGSRSAQFAVGGPQDLRRVPPRAAPRPHVAEVYKAANHEGPPPGKKWQLVWNEEFDGTTLDMDKWVVQKQQPWNWPGIKTQPSLSNLSLDGKGALVLQLTRDSAGTVRHFGSINSRAGKAFGYFETRVQFSRQPGWWTAVWLAGVPYDCGVDGFVNAQEFDIFEDFVKPKKENDVSHCYHCSVSLSRLDDQGNAKGVGEGSILNSKRLGRTSSGRKVIMEEYGGWHTVGFQWTPLEHIFYVDGQETLRQTYRDVPVTTVPQKVWISGCLRVPSDPAAKPFYGRLEEAQFPDSLVVDYVRIYDEDTGNRRPPQVTLSLAGKGPFKEGEKIAFEVAAESPGAKLKSLMLFSMGRIRAEKETDLSSVKTTFVVDNLFPLVRNTVIAMARDDQGLVGMSGPLSIELATGKEYTGTAYLGKPQKIPGTVQGGCYDEGGNGVAFLSGSLGPSDSRLTYRKEEVGDLPEAVPVGASRVRWICYEVEVAQAGDYEAELFMNRTDSAKNQDPGVAPREEDIRLSLGSPGQAGPHLQGWKLSTAWDSGYGWRNPQKSLGAKTVRLPAGRHKLVIFFDEISLPSTYFCKMVFRPAAPP